MHYQNLVGSAEKPEQTSLYFLLSRNSSFELLTDNSNRLIIELPNSYMSYMFHNNDLIILNSLTSIVISHIQSHISLHDNSPRLPKCSNIYFYDYQHTVCWYCCRFDSIFASFVCEGDITEIIFLSCYFCYLYCVINTLS